MLELVPSYWGLIVPLVTLVYCPHSELVYFCFGYSFMVFLTAVQWGHCIVKLIAISSFLIVYFSHTLLLDSYLFSIFQGNNHIKNQNPLCFPYIIVPRVDVQQIIILPKLYTAKCPLESKITSGGGPLIHYFIESSPQFCRALLSSFYSGLESYDIPY